MTCKSTIERIGIGLDSSDTDDGDVKQSKRSTYFEKERPHRNHRPHMARSTRSIVTHSGFSSVANKNCTVIIPVNGKDARSAL